MLHLELLVRRLRDSFVQSIAVVAGLMPGSGSRPLKSITCSGFARNFSDQSSTKAPSTCKECINLVNRPTHNAEEAYKALLEAIVDQRLPAGCRLTETALSQLMSCSRRHVEHALLRLAEQKLVTFRRNAGASVATPSYIEGHEIYELRSLLEVEVVQKVCALHRPEGLRRLRANLEAEAKVHRVGDHRKAVQLSGEFHVLLAEQSGNSVLQEHVRTLVARTSLVTQLHSNSEGLGCWHHQHGDLLNAIERRDADRACRLMRDHLLELKAALRVRPPRSRHHELERALTVPRDE